MTEIDIELLAMETAEPQPTASPEWFLIGMGIKPAPEAIYNSARIIYLQFIKFEATPFCETFEHVLEEFENARQQT